MSPPQSPEVDYILSFSLSSSSSPTSLPRAALSREYSTLLATLDKVGCDAVGRSGGVGSEKVLIFVRAREERVREEAGRERESDWLHGLGVSGSTSNTNPATSRNFTKEPLESSERLRLVYSILTSPSSPSTSTQYAGLSLVPNHKNFPHLLSIFPPHSPNFNKTWLSLWSSPRSHLLSIPQTELDSLANHFGPTIALYFAFLHFYFLSLLVPALIGSSFWAFAYKSGGSSSYSPVYSVILLIWSIVFVESWRIKEKELAVRWGTFGVERVEVLRAGFQGSEMRMDGVSGEVKAWFPWWKTLVRQLASIPVLILFAGVLAMIISTIYSIETIVGEVYDGPGKKFLALIPTILFSGLVPQFTKLWLSTARRLTGYENHPHQSEYANSLTLKVFALNFFVAYGSLLLTSYVYIPFGSLLVPQILSLLPHHTLSTSLKSPTRKFSINSSKLHTQIVAYTLTGQISGAFVEIGVPLLMRGLFKEVKSLRKGKEGKGVEDHESERAFLERVREEEALPEYTVFADYAEMTVQFGYLTMFSLIWPIAPLWAFINNFFELRGDAFKLASQSRRPVPSRDASIGPWLEVLGFITWFGALTNASLVYLYQPRLVSPDSPLYAMALNSSQALSNTTAIFQNGNFTKPLYCTAMHLSSLVPSVSEAAVGSGINKIVPDQLSSIKATLWTALLIALATEHGYFIARVSVRYLLNRALWSGGEAEMGIKRRELELRRAILRSDGGKEEVTPSEGEGRKDVELEKRSEKDLLVREGEEFWKRGDLGLEEIGREKKTE